MVNDFRNYLSKRDMQRTARKLNDAHIVFIREMKNCPLLIRKLRKTVLQNNIISRDKRHDPITILMIG